MTIVVAVTDDDQGRAALRAAVGEAGRRRTGVLAVNLTAGPLALPDDADDADGADDTDGGAGGTVRVLDRTAGVEDGDMVLEVLGRGPDVELLVLGLRRRSPVGKALFGDLAQRLLLEAEVPVLAVKAGAHGSKR